MSRSPNPARPTSGPSPKPSLFGRYGKSAAIAVGALGVVGTIMLAFGNPFLAAAPEYLTHQVERGTLNLSVMQRGTLESAVNRDIVCRVKSGRTGSTYIKWVIEDGSQVKAGQKLVELDASVLEADRQAQQIVVDTAYAAMVQAEEEHRIVVNQNLSDIETAKVNIELAALDLEKYSGLPRDTVMKLSLAELAKLDLAGRTPEKGEYRQLLDDVNGRMKLAESDLEMWTERAAWSERMVKKGYITPTQAQSERARLDSARESYKKVQMEGEVLQVFLKRRNETDLKSKLMEAKRALERTNSQAKAKEIKAENDFQTKRSIHLQEVSKLSELVSQIASCTITAPQAGMVVYYVDSSRFGSSQENLVVQGATVKEGQKLMRIPDLDRMVVNMRVHESAVMNIHGDEYRATGFTDGLTQVQTALLVTPFQLWALLSGSPFVEIVGEEIKTKFHDKDQIQLGAGQRATVRIDAFSKQLLAAHVKSVATVASVDFMTPDVKMFQTMVEIEGSLPGLKPGMSAEVNIVVEEPISDALIVPVSAIVGASELASTRKCYVMEGGKAVERTIEIGKSNDKQVQVVTGLKQGEMVVLNPKVIVGDSVKTRSADPAPAAGAGKDGKEGKGGFDPSKMKRPGGAGGPPMMKQ